MAQLPAQFRADAWGIDGVTAVVGSASTTCLFVCPPPPSSRLIAHLPGFWRYRIGDLRLTCKISDQELIVLVVEIGHRSRIN